MLTKSKQIFLRKLFCLTIKLLAKRSEDSNTLKTLAMPEKFSLVFTNGLKNEGHSCHFHREHLFETSLFC